MRRGLENKVWLTKADNKIETLLPTIQFSYKNGSFTSSLMGDYNLDNILTAIAIGEHLKVDLQDIRDGIAEYQPDNNRSQLIQKGTNRSEEHTSELQSRSDLVCRFLLEKKKKESKQETALPSRKLAYTTC